MEPRDYHRRLRVTLPMGNEPMGNEPIDADVNLKALEAGCVYGETAELISQSYAVQPASIPASHYRNITVNETLGYRT